MLTDLTAWFITQQTNIFVNLFSNLAYAVALAVVVYAMYKTFWFSSRTSGIWQGKLTPYPPGDEPCADTWIMVRLVVITRASRAASGFVQSSRHERRNTGEIVVVESVDEIDELTTKFPRLNLTKTFNIHLLPKYAFRKGKNSNWGYVLGRNKTVLKCHLTDPTTNMTTLVVDVNLELEQGQEVPFKGHLIKSN